MLAGRGYARSSRVKIAGLTSESWLALWFGCHSGNGMGGMIRTAWPDGGALVDQPAITVQLFAEIAKLVQAEASRD